MNAFIVPIVLVFMNQALPFGDSRIQVVGSPGSGGEGPAWHKDLGLLSSGLKGIHCLSPEGKSSVFLLGAGTNGLAFGPDGHLYACQPEHRRVIRIHPQTKAITLLADQFEGKKFNTPNDLCFDDQGRLYFSDPRYGDKADMQLRDKEGNTIEGVYRLDPDGKMVRVLGREVERANGVLVSRDGKWLFVADNNNDTLGGARKLWRFPRLADGSVNAAKRELVHDWKQGRGPDGLKQDSNGILYVAGGLNKPNPPFEPDVIPGGIFVLDPQKESGKRLITILPIPTDEVTNCAFGGSDLRTLFATGGGVLYSIRTEAPGHVRFSIAK